MDISNLEILKKELQSFAKPPNQRNLEDLNQILELTSQVPFFKKITKEKNNDFIHREACKFLKLQVFERKEPVINFGEIGEDFFIILKGKVGVFIPAKVAKFRQVSSIEDMKKNMIRKALDSNSQTFNDVSANEELIRKIFEDQILHHICILRRAHSKLDVKFLRKFGQIEELKEVAVLKEGDSFGELSLISDKPRAATIICKEFCVFATLNKTEFTRILSKETEKSLEEKANFLQKVPIFSRLAKSYLIKLSFYFTEIIFRKNKFVYKAGDPADQVFFIKSGEFKMAKWKSFKSRPVINQGSDMLLKFSNVREIPQGIDLQFSIKSIFEIFGQEEITQNLEKRDFSVVCVSTVGVVYAISKSEFKARISNPESKAYLNNRKKFISRRESEIENTEEILTNMSSFDKQGTTRFESFISEEEIQNMRNRLKSLRQKVHKAKILKNFDSTWYAVRSTDQRRHSLDATFPSPRRNHSPKREKTIQKESVATPRKLKRVPPPNFMIGMRDLSRFYDEDSRLYILNNRTMTK
jgi:CRP-like cAMP-binding protein